MFSETFLAPLTRHICPGLQNWIIKLTFCVSPFTCHFHFSILYVLVFLQLWVFTKWFLEYSMKTVHLLLACKLRWHQLGIVFNSLVQVLSGWYKNYWHWIKNGNKYKIFYFCIFQKNRKQIFKILPDRLHVAYIQRRFI